MRDRQKTVIVTGASQGIGAGLVEAFVKRGYSVVANSRNITKVNPFPASANVALVGGAIADPNTAATIVDTAVSRFGRTDALVVLQTVNFFAGREDFVEIERSAESRRHQRDHESTKFRNHEGEGESTYLFSCFPAVVFS